MKKTKCHCGGSAAATARKRHGSKQRVRHNIGKPIYTTMPVAPPILYGAGHVSQHGGDFLGIGRAFKKTFSNPLRGIAAVGTFGMSEAVLRGADAVESVTGRKASDVVGIIGTPLALATGGESAMPTAVVKAGLKLVGKGKKKPKRRRKKRKR